MARIKDIYAGKPDANDEVKTIGINPLIENYVIPDNFNTDALVRGTSYFITGYKGIGKTALLFYLDYYIREIDEQTCSSFVFFKEDYPDLKKQEMEELSKRLFSSISIGDDVALDGNDFEYIWRWLLYVRIIEDNEKINYGLFEKNFTWNKFEKVISCIKYNKKRSFLKIPDKLHIECKFEDEATGVAMTPSSDLNFSDSGMEKSEGYRMFVQLIEEADSLFEELCELYRTDIPYYIFVDELEAYYGDKDIFRRDLNLIRDLIFTVKRIDLVMAKSHKALTKIICSVRSEILKSINRFAVTKELNKVISGYEVPLKWDYKNTNSFQHPILKILLKRIAYADNNFKTDKELIDKWFPEKIHETRAAKYILNNSWCKPRDIVRLILSAQNCMAAYNESFTQNTFDMCKKQYSQDSLDEIREEMRALYSAEEIDVIIVCLTGFKRKFTYQEIEERVNRYYANTFLADRLQNVLIDIYRLGIIGNFMGGQYRWQHKGDNDLVTDDNWSIIVHPALISALSVSSQQDRLIDGNVPKEGEVVQVKISRIFDHYAFGSFHYGNDKYTTFLHISNISSFYVSNIYDYLEVGKIYNAILLQFNDIHNNWNIRLK